MITVLFGGSRPEGNTAELTRYTLDGLDYTWVDVTQYQFNPVRDVLSLIHISEPTRPY